MPSQLPVFRSLLKKRGRAWKWSVCTADGRVMMEGSESRRISASYKANRALFLMLLCAPYSHVRPPDACEQHTYSSSRSNI